MNLRRVPRQPNRALAVSASELRKSFGGRTILDGSGLAIPVPCCWRMSRVANHG